MLGKYEWEILQEMPFDELSRWLAYLSIKSEEIKNANKPGAGPRGSGIPLGLDL